MAANKTVNEYLNELKQSKKNKPEQIKDALEIYIDLWDRTIQKGVVSLDDDIEVALSKIEREGGLYESGQ
jgi:hypothetical protein